MYSSIEKEVWKDIKGYKGIYEVSNFGRVRSLDRISCSGRKLKGRILKQKINKSYNMVGLSKGGEQKHKTVSRLVGFAFVDNPENKPQINHIDENKQNNHVDNLEWVTAKENSNHGTRNDRVIPYLVADGKEQRKPIVKIDIETNKELNTFASINEAYRSLGVEPGGGISRVCQGKAKTARGYKWRYLD